jgi:RIO-like serine/threonine protein kinase
MSKFTIIRYDKYTVKKVFDLHHCGVNSFNRSFRMCFDAEKRCYELLKNQNVTPKLIDIEDNSIVMEKYDLSLETALRQNTISSQKWKEIYDKICQKVKILDCYRILHNDLHPRNIVCKNNFEDIAIIDFELANILSEETKLTNFNYQFYENFCIF